MPKALSEFNGMQEVEARKGGRKVDWADVSSQIIESGQAYTVKEVWSDLCDKAVTQFRVKNALDGLVEKKVLRRLWDGKRFYYGPYVPETTETTEPAQPAMVAPAQ